MSDKLDADTSREEWGEECARCGVFMNFDTTEPAVDYYPGWSGEGGTLCENCGDDFEKFLESKLVTPIPEEKAIEMMERSEDRARRQDGNGDF